MMLNSVRHNRHTQSLCVTRAGQSDRHNRHTPLRGVTCVTLARLAAVSVVIAAAKSFSPVVPMPKKDWAWGGAVRDSEATHTAGGLPKFGGVSIKSVRVPDTFRAGGVSIKGVGIIHTPSAGGAV